MINVIEKGQPEKIGKCPELIHKEGKVMDTLKQEALNVIAKIPETADIDTIMYRLYVIDKIRKGKEAAERGETISIEDLKREIESW
jgi:hypothetical protein